MFILVVDDEKCRHERFEKIFPQQHVVMHAYNTDEAIDKLQTYTFGMICLDHDLGDKKKDGRLLARWMRDNNIIPDKVLIHSKNIITNREMAALLRDKGWNGELKILPFESE